MIGNAWWVPQAHDGGGAAVELVERDEFDLTVDQPAERVACGHCWRERLAVDRLLHLGENSRALSRWQPWRDGGRPDAARAATD